MDELISPLSENALDLETIKDSLKQYILDNSSIIDVDFEGSNISILLDVISYVEKNINSTHALNSNEMILPTSNTKSNIIHWGQTLSYNITRVQSSKINVTISLDTLIEGEYIVIPQWSKFECGDYTFLNTEEITLTYDIPSATIDLIEGVFIDYTIDSNLRYTLPSSKANILINYDNIEHDHIYFRVKKDGESNFSDYFTLVDSKLKIKDTENNFFVDIDPDTDFMKLYTSFAGNGTIFNEGDIFDMSFVLSSGSVANNILVCESNTPYFSNLANRFALNITVNSASRSGTDQESLDSIKETAPLFYNTGDRTVNEIDYEAFLVKNSLVEKAVAYGGETVIPMNLGHVYLSCIPQDVNNKYLTPLEESDLIQYLSDPRIIATGKYFRHPIYFKLDFNVRVLGTVTNLTYKKEQILDSLNIYFTEEQTDFKTDFFIYKVFRLIETVFIEDTKASIRIEYQPKIEISQELFEQSLDNTVDIYIPNSPRKYYLFKDGNRIEVPDNEADTYVYLINGWTKEIAADDDLDITIHGTINSKDISVSDISDVIVLDDDNYDKYDIYLDVDVIGYYIPSLNRITLNDIRSELIQELEYILIDYAPDMNVKLEKNTLLTLGNVEFM